jgi:hypothetical protein
MTTAIDTRKPTPTVSLVVRTCVAVVVVVMLALVWTLAGRSSHLAVQEAQVAMNRTYVTLPRVEVAGKREPADAPVVVRTRTKRPPQG